MQTTGNHDRYGDGPSYGHSATQDTTPKVNPPCSHKHRTSTATPLAHG